MVMLGVAEDVSTIISKKYSRLVVRLSKESSYTDTFDLEFDLIDSPFLPKWIDRFLHAQQRQDTISEPWAMYNLNNSWDDEYTINFINFHIKVCNDIVPNMFDSAVSDVNDQDTLNYVHSVFELHHGQLDTWQNNPIFSSDRGDELRQSLSHINQTVHRLESSSAKIRVVYFDLPKTKQFTEDDYKLFTNDVTFGGVYTMYADVGKNLESLATDDDDHHHDFVPNLHYSADFYIKLHNKDGNVQQDLCNKFLHENIDYFTSKGYSYSDPRLTTGAIKLAQLNYSDKKEILTYISNYDNIQSAFIL